MAVENIQFQMDLLWRDGYHAAARIIEVLQNTVSRAPEINYLKEFVREGDFSEELYRNQLRCLWTAYCFHQRLDVDTSGYDNDLLDLWSAMEEKSGWNGYDSFDNFMCKHLV